MKKLFTVFVVAVLVLSSSGVAPLLVYATTTHDGPGVDCGKGNDFQNNGQQKGVGPQHCDQGGGEGQGEQTGSITVCKVILDAQGNVISGTAGPSFGIPLTGLDFSQTATFVTPIDLNSNLIGNVDHPDANCQSAENLPLGTYNYLAETGTNSDWNEPLYNDGFSGTISNFLSDTYHLVADNAPGDNDNNDGVINLTAEAPDRVLVVVNQLSGGECEATDAVNTYKSDALTTWGAGNPSVVVDPQNVGWTGQIADTDWIWIASATSDADALNGATYTFTRHFTITGTPLDSQLEMSSDNGYSIKVNNILIDANADEFNYHTTHNFSIPAGDLHTGDNVITFEITNMALEDGTPDNNPGGLTYKLDVHENDCVAPPQACDANTVQNFTSGGDETFFSTKMLPGNAVPTFVHSAWAPTNTGDLTGATWIWDAFHVVDPTQDETVVFTKHLNVTGNHIDAGSIDIAADNGYKIVLNGHVVVDMLSDTGNNYGAAAHYDLASALQSGDNELDITVKNIGITDQSDPEQNPAGVAYKVNVTSDNCQEPTPPVCEAPQNVANTIISDTDTQVDSHDSVFVGLPYHISWTALISGVKWIWSEDPIADAVNETTKDFSRNFNILGTPKASTLEMASDNSFTVWVNGFELGTDPSEFNYFAPTHTYAIPAALLNTGSNSIAFRVTNFAMENGTPLTNPGGLLYKVTQNEVDCGEVPPPVDVCSNIGGNQTTPPEGTHIEGTQCLPDVTPQTDVCSNIEGDQATPPEGTHLSGDECIADVVVIETDLCPNIDGNQSEVPAGMHLNNDNQCVDNGNSNNNDNNGGGGGGGGGGNTDVVTNFVGSSGGSHGGGGGNGQVLGASTENDKTCGVYLTSYLRKGNKNPKSQVVKLQTFLNSYLHLNIPVTGFFGPQTLAAVNQFQVQEGQNVLSPWVKAGLHDSATDPTGYVYKTTKRWINLIMCNSLQLPVPTLP